MRPANNDYLRELVRQDSGVVLGPDKEYLVESRLVPIRRRDGDADLDALVGRVRAGSPGLRAQVVDALTTHETYFFRDVHPFDTLRAHVVPELLASRPGRRLSIWSAAAATGQEPYSVAMMWLEHFVSTPVSILATDVSTACVEAARRGRFTQLEVNRGLPVGMLVKYFDRDGLHWVVQERVRAMVSVRLLNLVRPWPALAPMDVVLLRNVLTYFDRDTRAAVLRRVAALLRPGGFLLLGGAETTVGIDTGLQWTRIGKTVCYRKEGGSDGQP